MVARNRSSGLLAYVLTVSAVGFSLLAILIGHATRCALSVIRFDQGKWRSIRVE